MKKKGQLLYCFSVCVLLSGCNILSRPLEDERRYFVLLGETSPATQGEQKPEALAEGKVLLLSLPKAAPFLNSQRIAFGEGNTRGYYQFSSWVEAPPQRLQYILIDKLRQASLFSTVISESTPLSPELVLNSELQEFYHDKGDPPGNVKVIMNVELIDFRQKKLLAQQLFTVEKEVKDYSATGAVNAFSQAVEALSQELLNWVKQNM